MSALIDLTRMTPGEVTCAAAAGEVPWKDAIAELKRRERAERAAPRRSRPMAPHVDVRKLAANDRDDE